MLHPKTLGRTIAEVRGLRGMTQKGVAERCGLTINYLSLIEHGERSISFDALNAVAAALNVPAEWLLLLAGEGLSGPLAGSEFERLHETTRSALRAAIKADINPRRETSKI